MVGSVGGWLYDRVRAGWDVNVLLPQRCDTRPLQILGMQAADLDSQILAASTECAARGLAVSADMFAVGRAHSAGGAHRAGSLDDGSDSLA